MIVMAVNPLIHAASVAGAVTPLIHAAAAVAMVVKPPIHLVTVVKVVHVIALF
ncbi:hypothetical protein [Streptomyces sp. NPDC005251]|uniref:hypothetical protein n=1 Tax=unclassified Streptomyces TaxID=2593676 RepID=UPI0033BDAA3E